MDYQENDDIEIALLNSEEINKRTSNMEIILDQDAYHEMQLYSKTDLSRELGGVIVGYFEKKDNITVVTIKGAIEARYTESDKTTVKFTHKSWEYINQIKDKYFSNYKIVGWFHTHPGFGIFLSEYDQFIQRNFFNLPWQVAFVLDPVSHNEGFFCLNKGEIETCDFRIDNNGFKNGGYVFNIREYNSLSNDKTQKNNKSRMIAFGLFMLCIASATSYYLGIQQGIKQSQNLSADIQGLPIIMSKEIDSETNLTQTEEATFQHLVKKGDTLWDISCTYYQDGNSFEKIANLNGITDPRMIIPGQIIVIPVD